MAGLADILAAQNYGPGPTPAAPPAVAGGTPAVDISEPQPGAAPHNADYSPFRNMLLGATNMAPTPAMQAQQDLATSAAITQSGLKLANILNFFGGNDASTAALKQRQDAADFQSQPAVINAQANNPQLRTAMTADPTGQAQKLAPLIAAAQAAAADPGQHTYTKPDGTAFTKTAPDPAHVAMQAAITGEDPKHVNAFLNHHDFTDEEFLHATAGMSYKQGARLFAMQHYLTPQQQLIPQYAQDLQSTAQKAQADYEKAIAGGTKAEQAETLKARDAANNAILAFHKKGAEGQLSLYGDSAVGIGKQD